MAQVGHQLKDRAAADLRDELDRANAHAHRLGDELGRLHSSGDSSTEAPAPPDDDA